MKFKIALVLLALAGSLTLLSANPEADLNSILLNSKQPLSVQKPQPAEPLRPVLVAVEPPKGVPSDTRNPSTPQVILAGYTAAPTRELANEWGPTPGVMQQLQAGSDRFFAMNPNFIGHGIEPEARLQNPFPESDEGIADWEEELVERFTGTPWLPEPWVKRYQAAQQAPLESPESGKASVKPEEKLEENKDEPEVEPDEKIPACRPLGLNDFTVASFLPGESYFSKQARQRGIKINDPRRAFVPTLSFDEIRSRILGSPDYDFTDYDEKKEGIRNGQLMILGHGGQLILKLSGGYLDPADTQLQHFVVFENSVESNDEKRDFQIDFGFVGVSQDGVRFVEFPCNIKAQPPVRYSSCAGVNPSQVGTGGDRYNLAVIGAELKAAGIEKVRYIRLSDSGLNHAEAAAGSEGFDLDAFNILHGCQDRTSDEERQIESIKQRNQQRAERRAQNKGKTS